MLVLEFNAVEDTRGALSCDFSIKLNGRNNNPPAGIEKYSTDLAGLQYDWAMSYYLQYDTQTTSCPLSGVI